MSGDLARQLGSLDDMATDELRSRWRALTGTPAPKVSPSVLRLALAFELQAKAYGGLSRRTQQTLAQLAGGKTQTREAGPGMRLVREWNGVVHVVEVGEDGVIRWNGQGWGWCCQSYANRSPQDGVWSMRAWG